MCTLPEGRFWTGCSGQARTRAGPRAAAAATDLPAIVITTNRLVYGGAERQKSVLAS